MLEKNEPTQIHGNQTTLKKDFLQPIVSRTLIGQIDNSVSKNPEYLAAVPEITEIYEQVWRWHGTGKYHYHDDGIKDVSKEIIDNTGLIPHDDPLDYTRGLMQSISTSPSRIYSSLYAQLHYEKGKSLRNTFQTTSGWIYFTGSIAIQATTHDRRLFSKKFRQEHSLDKKGTSYFHEKYTKSQVPGLDMRFGGVSDIPGNYPVLIGIKYEAFKEANIAKVLRTHESRSETPIPISSFTHIEVPRQKVSDLVNILDQKDIKLPVIPIEWGEELCKSLPTSFLKDGVPLK